MRIVETTLVNSSTPISTPSVTDPLFLRHLIGCSLAVTFTADSNWSGDFVLQASNDEENWADIYTKTITGTGETCMFNVTDTYYKMIRIKVAPTTGSILTFHVQVYAKGW